MRSVLLSFGAGLVLNFMPCILPILLIKIYDIVKYSQTNQNKNNLKIISIATTFGILFTFLIFSFISILFKYTGKSFNFGFHFQNPYFLIIVIFILFMFLLNLLNFFNIHYSPRIINYIQQKYERSKNLQKGIYVENFITGIFMVLFATPCSIPVLGTVATFSLITDSYLSILCNFLAMGLGMSVPFIIVALYPNFLDFLKSKKAPLKFIHVFIILSLGITIIWLLYVLKIEIGIKSAAILICFLLLMSLQFKLVKKNIQNLILVFFIFLAGTIFPVSIFKEEQAIKISNSLWQSKITKEEINKYILEGKTVFVNISAKWCIICNFNNITAFSKYDVVKYLSNKNIVSIKIDITQNNEEASEFYKDTGRIYVPKYIVFNKKFPNGCSFTGRINEKQFFTKVKNCM